MKQIYEEINKALESKVLTRILRLVGIAILSILIFLAGITVGFHKASFGRAWGEHYSENFGFGRPAGRMGDIDKAGMMNYFPNANGATGKILKIELPNIIVEDRANTEKVISIGDGTIMQKGGALVTAADLKIDDFVVVIGTPDSQGVIEAKFIRILPNPEFMQPPGL